MSGIDLAHERRDSPRVPMRFLIRSEEGGAFQEYEGDLSIGGIAVPLSGRAHRRYEIRFQLAGTELHARGEPVSPGTSRDRLQLRFVDLDTASERAIARFLDDLQGSR